MRVLGACWLPVVWLQVVWLQVQLRDDALAAPGIGKLPARFHRRFAAWFALGWPAFAGVLVLFALMLARGWFAP